MSSKTKLKPKEKKAISIDGDAGLMLNKPKCCSMCEKKFDDKSLEDHMTWAVAVNEGLGKVFMYCPDCKEKGRKLHEALNG